MSHRSRATRTWRPRALEPAANPTAIEGCEGRGTSVAANVARCRRRTSASSDRKGCTAMDARKAFVRFMGGGWRRRAATMGMGAQAEKKGAVDSGDRQIMETMARAGVAEVEAGRVAETHAARADVKKFARQMVEDHGKANRELHEI